MTARTVRGFVEAPIGSGSPCVGARTVAQLYTDGNLAYGTANDVVLGSTANLTDNSGFWSLDLEPNDGITPAGTVWQITTTPPDGTPATYYIEVPDTAGPHDVTDLLVEEPGALPSQALASHAALSVAHGTAGAIVGTTNTQTLTNKTLTDPTITLTAEKAAAFRATSLSQRTHRLDVREFADIAGGGDATEAIQAALTEAGEGDEVYVPDLGWLVSEALVIPADGVSLVGAAHGSTLVRATNGAYPLVLISGRDRARVARLRLTGAASAHVAGSYGIQMSDCTFSVVEDCHIQDQPGDGIGLDTTANTDCLVRNNTVRDCYGHGIQFTSAAHGTRIVGNDVASTLGVESGSTGYVLGYTSTHSERVIIQGNRADGFTQGFQINHLDGAEISGNQALNCTHPFVLNACIRSDLSDGVAVDSAPDINFGGAITLTECEDVTVDGNLVQDVTSALEGYGGGIRLFANCSKIHVTGNTLLGCEAFGVSSDADSSVITGNLIRDTEVGIQLWGAEHSVVTGNTIDSAETGVFLANGPNYSEVTGNVFLDSLAVGAGAVGIDVAANTQNCNIHDNWFAESFVGTKVQLSTTGTSTTFAAHTPPSGTGSTRPSAATAGAGAMWWDQSLNKPLWSDGTNWRDATGTTI